MITKHIQEQTSPEERVKQSLDQLYKKVAPAWPLGSAVACNPLQGLEHLPFSLATEEGQKLFDANCLPGLWQLLPAASDTIDDIIEELIWDEPECIGLNGQSIPLEPFIRAMLDGFNDQQHPGAPSPLLNKSLPFLYPQYDWQAIIPSVNKHCISWLGAFLDEGQASWSMPYRSEGFFVAVKRLLTSQARYKQYLSSLPDNSEESITLLLNQLHVQEDEKEQMLSDHLFALPGWTSYIKWRSEQADYPAQQDFPISLNDYLAVRLLYTRILPPAERSSEPYAPIVARKLAAWAESYLKPDSDTDAYEWATLLTVLQRCYHQLRLALLTQQENTFSKQLNQQLLSQVNQQNQPTTAHAQLAFCIDVRSEPFRKQLEQAGHYETFGFAGFFGIPIAYRTLLKEDIKSLPVLLQPAHYLHEEATPTCKHQEGKYQSGKQLLKELKSAYKSLKYNVATPFAAVEALGLPAAMVSTLRSFFPGWQAKIRKQGNALLAPEIERQLDIDDALSGIPLNKQIEYAGNALRLMGMTGNFAPLVVFCGHGSQTENNPYAAALDCGACGGHHGGPNAVALARMLNKEAVREALLNQHKIVIPETTIFLGAEHNTTTDEVVFLALPEHLSEQQLSQLNQLKADLVKAQQQNLVQRAALLGAANPNDLLKRSIDWSEVRPEWGLAGNAGFIVAPRHLTANLNLKGQCFLHSYDWKQDPEGGLLETILTAPLVVAQWINSQYFFSTTDNTAFGSGSKITHNVTSKVGVMQGNGGDLMHGLPWQSVMKDDHTPQHQPMRLQALVYAPQVMVDMLVEKHSILQKMFYNEWVCLRVLDPGDHKIWKLQPHGEWITE